MIILKIVTIIINITMPVAITIFGVYYYKGIMSFNEFATLGLICLTQMEIYNFHLMAMEYIEEHTKNK